MSESMGREASATVERHKINGRQRLNGLDELNRLYELHEEAALENLLAACEQVRLLLAGQ